MLEKISTKIKKKKNRSTLSQSRFSTKNVVKKKKSCKKDVNESQKFGSSVIVNQDLTSTRF